MRVFTEKEAGDRLSDVLDVARLWGEVRMKRGDGQEFAVRPAVAAPGSPLDVGSVDLGLTADEIVAAVRQGRERQDSQDV